MIFLKDSSVLVENFTPKLMFALGVITQAFGAFAHDLVITAGQDGHHNPGSLHASGNAVDIRVNQFNKLDLNEVVHDIVQRLEPLGFDVVLESSGATPMTTAAHLHVEYDPKGRVFWRELAHA